MDKKIIQDIKTLLSRYIDSIEIELLNSDQFDEEELEYKKDEKNYAIKILKKL